MPRLQLPRTHGCLVCGRENPRGLRLELFVDDLTGVVTTDVAFGPEFIGFVDVLHGGIVATVADEAMVWAATWAGRRFCLCAELNVRYRKPARPGVQYRFEASVESSRAKLITTTCRMIDAGGAVIATASAKYMPVSAEQHAEVVKTFVNEEATRLSATELAK